MKNVYVLLIDPGAGTGEISTVVSTSADNLIDYVINEELPEQGYSSEEIEEMRVELMLAERLYWEDPEGVIYSINESKMI